jgi:hypothetical protein
MGKFVLIAALIIFIILLIKVPGFRNKTKNFFLFFFNAFKSGVNSTNDYQASISEWPDERIFQELRHNSAGPRYIACFRELQDRGYSSDEIKSRIQG